MQRLVPSPHSKEVPGYAVCVLSMCGHEFHLGATVSSHSFPPGFLPHYTLIGDGECVSVSVYVLWCVGAHTGLVPASSPKPRIGSFHCHLKRDESSED